jgi:hypothetical protein
MRLTINRNKYRLSSTIGTLLIDGEFFCYTLEDTVRAKHVKIKHHTAIAEGIYEVAVTRSNRFKRDMPILLNVPMFEGIRIHGGNTHKNTSGCPLVAYKLINDVTIQGSAEKDLTQLIKDAIDRGQRVTIEICNDNLFPHEHEIN